MALDPGLIAAMARALLGWTEADAAALSGAARRLEAVLREVGSLDRAVMQTGFPAFAFDPGWAFGLDGGPGADVVGDSGGSGSRVLPDDPAAGQGRSGSPLDWPLMELAAALRRGEVSPVALTEAALQRIAAQDGELKAFVAVEAERALAAAREAERQGPQGPLHGVPVAVKDLFDAAGWETTAGSRVLTGRRAERDAAAVARLRAAGAILIGKTATHEFAFGTTTSSPLHGQCRNPLDRDRVPGGSSGGSGAAVAAGMVPLALGTDTAGSVRIPAACCGVVGLMPTYGRVSRAGVIPLSPSLDHVGPLARTVPDVALALSALAGGPDPQDPACSARPAADYLHAALSGRKAAGTRALAGIRIGLPASWLAGPIEPEVARSFDLALARLRAMGAEVVEVAFPPLELYHLVSRLLTLAEAGAWHAPNLPERAGEYGRDVRARVELGQFLLARDYLLAHRVRGEVARGTGRAMAEARLHALLLPTMPIPAPLVGQRTYTYPDGQSEPVAEAMIRLTAPFNVTGQPAVALPCRSASVQLVGRPFGEAGLLYIAAALEAALDSASDLF